MIQMQATNQYFHVALFITSYFFVCADGIISSEMKNLNRFKPERFLKTYKEKVCYKL